MNSISNSIFSLNSWPGRLQISRGTFEMMYFYKSFYSKNSKHLRVHQTKIFLWLSNISLLIQCLQLFLISCLYCKICCSKNVCCQLCIHKINLKLFLSRNCWLKIDKYFRFLLRLYRIKRSYLPFSLVKIFLF